MNRFIFGFQRRVWWPKWTPASSNCFMVTTATGTDSFSSVCVRPPARCAGSAHTDGLRACKFPTGGGRVGAQCSRTAGSPLEAAGAPAGGAGRAVKRRERDSGLRRPEEGSRVLRPAVDAVAEVHDAGPVAGARCSRQPEDVGATD